MNRTGIALINTIVFLSLLCQNSCKPCPVCPPCPTCERAEHKALSDVQYQKKEWFVVHVTDGDTIVAKRHETDGTVRQEKIRFLNINTPERGQPLYAEAKETLKEMVRGGDIFLEFETPMVENRGNYGRLLAYVIAEGLNTNIEMVRQGYSKYWTKYGKSRFHQEFIKAEQEARENNRGIWKR